MSLILVYGAESAGDSRGPLRRAICQAALGRHARPATASTLPSYRGDLVNRPAFTAEARTPDPRLLLRGYERAALTLNFIRGLVDGGFADLHHPELWDLDFVQARRPVGASIGRSSTRSAARSASWRRSPARRSAN